MLLDQDQTSGHYQRAVILGQNQTFGQYVPLKMRGILLVRTKLSGNMYLLKCEILIDQNQTSGQYFPLKMRGSDRSEPNFRLTSTSRNARFFSVRGKLPGNMYLLKCEVLLGQNQTSGRCAPRKNQVRGTPRSEPIFRAIFIPRKFRAI